MCCCVLLDSHALHIKNKYVRTSSAARGSARLIVIFIKEKQFCTRKVDFVSASFWKEKRRFEEDSAAGKMRQKERFSCGRMGGEEFQAEPCFSGMYFQ